MPEQKKKISVVMPIVSERWNDNMQEVLNRYLSPGFEVNLVNVKYGGDRINNWASYGCDPPIYNTGDFEGGARGI